MKNQKNIIIAIIVLALSSIIFLSVLEHTQHTGEDSQGWWSVYFVAPYDEKSLDFVIENYDDKNKFTYEVILGDEVIKSESIEVNNGEFKNVKLDIEKENGKSVEIKISLSGEKKSKSVFKR